MKQFLLDNEPDANGRVTIKGKDVHYLSRVRRMKSGDTLKALLPSGESVTLLLKDFGRGFINAEIVNTAQNNEAPHSGKPYIVLLQAMAKSAKMDIIIRQAAEAGIDEIVPFISERTEGGTEGNGVFRAESRAERWRLIIKEARQQSGSMYNTALPVIIKGLPDVFEYCNKKKMLFERGAAFVLCEKPEQNAENYKKGSFHLGLFPRPDIVFAAVGPEGGFSDTENAAFVENGFIKVNMGLKKTVLRVETAAVWAACAISVILGENETWTLKE